MKYVGISSNLYQPLSANEIKLVHEAAVKVLENTGYMVENDEYLKMFSEVGCKVDFEKKIVKVSESILMDYVKKAPSKIRLYGRDSKHDVIIEPNKVVFQQGGTALYIYDRDTGERREGKLEDIAEAIKIADHLENLHILEPPVTAAELEKLNPGEKDINRFFVTANNTKKPFCMGLWEDPKHVIEMATIIAGGKEKLREKPFVGFISTSVSPLKADPGNIDWVKQGVEAGIPVFWAACPISGLSAPMSLAGLLVQAIAEGLFNVFFVQVLKGGAPTVISMTPIGTDMKSLYSLMGYVEMGLMSAALSQVASFYNLPLYCTGGLTESKKCDIQAGIEKSMMTLLAALSGGQYIHDVCGMLDSTSTYSLEQLVIDDVINGMALRVLKGIEINENSLAVEVINSIGAGGEELFLNQEHTMKYMRSEFYKSKLLDRQSWNDWSAAGSKDMYDRARETVTEILKTQEPKKLSDEIIKELKKIFPALIL